LNSFISRAITPSFLNSGKVGNKTAFLFLLNGSRVSSGRDRKKEMIKIKNVFYVYTENNSDIKKYHWYEKKKEMESKKN
jgi:hypothetical protein